jgi:hypothetical protein
MPVAAAESWRRLSKIWAGQTDRLRRLYDTPQIVQTDLLANLISLNVVSAFGADHGFSKIGGYDDYVSAVPVASYEDHRHYIDRLAKGEPNQLTAEPALFVEMTGGSTGGSKVIPYTASALDGYARALNPWLADLIERHPEVARGRIYFSLSPAGRPPGSTIGTLPLGSAEQFEYFGDAGSELAALSIAPSALSELTDIEEWRFATCLHLLAARDLSLIWVWSPTYLSELLHAIRRMKHRLVEVLAKGGPAGAPYPPAAPSRAAELAELIEDDRIDTESIWPQLSVISCWMDASSTPFASELQRQFPGVFFQAKGLMATEGATTLPFGEGPGSPLAIESAFFEFADERGAITRAWELELGEVRRVILSNWSGFYRYDTGDLAEVVGFEGATPRLRFIGRAGKTSDLCGEKLSEQFVLACLERVIGGGGHYAFLAPVLKPQLHYELWIDGLIEQTRLKSIALAMDEALCENPQYAYARSLGQLQPITASGAPELYETYQNWAVSTGKNLGHLKAPALVQALPDELRAHLERFGE